MIRPRLATTLLSGLVIAGALLWSYAEQRPQGGVEIRATAAGGCPSGGPACPRAANVRVTKPGRRETLAGGRVAAPGSVRFRLQPGSYVIRAGRDRRWQARPVRVHVPAERYVPVVVSYQPRRSP
jgi:hypothetical protein